MILGWLANRNLSGKRHTGSSHMVTIYLGSGGSGGDTGDGGRGNGKGGKIK